MVVDPVEGGLDMCDEVEDLLLVKFVDLFPNPLVLDVSVLLPQSIEEGEEAADDVKCIQVLEVDPRVIYVHKFLSITQQVLRRSWR